jgi:DHA1 family inner membrane transport protein
VISVLVTGSSFGIILGVPTGTWLGQQAGWRTAFLALSGFGLLAFLAVISLVPTAPPGRGHAAFGTAPDTRRFRIVVVTTSLVILGYFTCSTYITVFLTEVSGFTSKAIGPLLLLSGVAGIGGTVASGVVAGRSPRAAMMVPVALLMATMLGLYLLGTGRAVTAGLVALAGLSMGALVPALQNRVMEVAPGSSEIASAANSAAFNVGIAGGAFLGGVLLPVSGVRGTALAGATLAAAGLVVLLSEPLVTAPRRTPLVRRGHS